MSENKNINQGQENNEEKQNNNRELPAQCPYQINYNLGPGSPKAADELEIDLLELFFVLWRAKWLIAGLVIVAALIAGIYGLSQEHEYEAFATFTVSGADYIETEFGERQRLDADILLSILESNNLALNVVEDLKLVEYWEADSQLEAANKVRDGINIVTGDNDATITISYVSTDPQMAKDMIESYINNFEEINQDVNMTESAQALEFVEERLTEVEENLEDLENGKRRLQESFGIYDFDVQVSRLAETFVNFQEKLQDKLIEYNVKTESLSGNHPDLRELGREIQEIERALLVMEQGVREDMPDDMFEVPDRDRDFEEAPEGEQDFEGLPEEPGSEEMSEELGELGELGELEELEGLEEQDEPAPGAENAELAGEQEILELDERLTEAGFGMIDIPTLSLRLTTLEQEMEIFRESYVMLRNQQENLQVEAAREQNLVRIIDEPRFPESPVGRGVTLMVAVAVVLAGMIGVFLAFLREFLMKSDIKERFKEYSGN